jgi:hypothetical protein
VIATKLKNNEKKEPRMKRPELIYEFFTPEQLQRAREQPKPKLAPVVGEQLSFSLRFNPVTKTEHQQRLRNELIKKGE